MLVSEAIRTKRAVRHFQDKALPEEVVHAILNAGRRSQSSKNNQAWQFIANQDKEVLRALSACGEWAGHIAGAALAVAILTPDPTEKFQHLFDAGQAAAFMQLTAWNWVWGRARRPFMNLKRRVRYWVFLMNGICASFYRLDIHWKPKN
jgi:nitroreductase